MGILSITHYLIPSLCLDEDLNFPKKYWLPLFNPFHGYPSAKTLLVDPERGAAPMKGTPYRLNVGFPTFIWDIPTSQMRTHQMTMKITKPFTKSQQNFHCLILLTDRTTFDIGL